MRLRNRVLYWGTFITSVIYIVWRTFFTLPFGYGNVAVFFGIYLLVVEILGMLESANHFLGMAHPLKPEKPIVDPALFPKVDVLIPTYNEPVELLRKTLIGAKNMEYPDPTKVRIILCDDGVRPEMKALAEELGVEYATRTQHKHAKAGNLNEALKICSSELVAVFDADMIPLNHFLMETVPYFFREENVGFIQTPQAFYNPDLFQYHLYSEHRIPDEQDYFYRDVQLAKNRDNVVIFGGSNTLLSRKALDDVGGFRTGVITEDFATGMLIQNEGYRCYAIEKVCAIGLAPTDIKSLFKQRERWARGCIQTIRIVNLFGLKGLSIRQKIGYLSSIWYWYEPYKRLIYILAPLLFAAFDILVVRTTLVEVLVFWFPMYWFSGAALKRLSRGIRTTKWTNIYNTILFPYLLWPVLLETFGIRMLKFSVTKKERTTQSLGFRIKWAIPHAILFGISMYAIARIIERMFLENTLAYSVIFFWLLINAYNLLMSVFFMLGREPMRNSERFIAEIDVKLSSDTQCIQTKTLDISEGGFSIRSPYPFYFDPEKTLDVQLQEKRWVAQMKANIVSVREIAGGWQYAYRFVDVSRQEMDHLYSILYNREPSLPTKLPDHVSTFEDLSLNVQRRFAKNTSFNRKLARIRIHETFFDDTLTNVELRDFNYEYMLVHGTDRPKIELDLEGGLVLKGEFSREQGSFGSLYKVTNAQELRDLPQFQAKITAWIAKEKKAEIQRKKRGGLEDEFNENEYL